MTGLTTDVQLNYAIVAQDLFLPESELYYVAHNTNFSSCMSICKQGAFRPSKWNQDDVTRLPPLTFYARGHLVHESAAFRKAAEYKSDARPFYIWLELKPGKWTTRNQSPEGLIRNSLQRIFEVF